NLIFYGQIKQRDNILKLMVVRKLNIFIELIVFWRNHEGRDESFGVLIRYQTPQSVYAIPKDGWQHFRDLDKSNSLPRIVYVPPFSGIEPNEIWYDDGIVRKNVGKAQPGSIIRNLLYRVIDKDTVDKNNTPVPLPVSDNKNWKEVTEKIRDWFGVKLKTPFYEKGVSTEIKVTFKTNNEKAFDIIAGGSGFHQVLTLMAFMYGYSDVTTILFDEPDAHLHVNLQRTILNYLKTKKDIQFIIATHSEEFIKGVDTHAIISVLSDEPKRIQSKPSIITALSEVDNMTVIRTTQSPFILYVEGEDDERLLNAWATILGKNSIFDKYYVEQMGGSTKDLMKKYADNHFNGLKQIVPDVKRIILLDYYSEKDYHPESDNPVVREWKRKNIENYLLVPDAWKRAMRNRLNMTETNRFTHPYIEEIDNFFGEQNLTLPAASTWENIKANIFQEVNGKKILFEMEDSLFQRIFKLSQVQLTRESIATSMTADEIHKDIKEFFDKMSEIPDEEN
ncbi:MAG TPA: AAA family ATPase, partial [Thermodesulfovibrionia bacterium]|nr:AAA family ATPase [Thermodesulfovibrionia bacterium]